jgi:hypothetical protein
MSRKTMVLTTALLLAGCAQPGPLATFGLARQDLGAPQASRALPGAARGSLTLDLSAIAKQMAKRTVLFAVADVDHLEVVITQEPGYFTRSVVTHAELTGGSATRTFTDVPGGSIRVTISARDAQDRVLGLDDTTLFLDTSQAVTYAPKILLLPTDAIPSNAPAGYGSGYLPASHTTLTFDLSVGDGGALYTPTVLASIPHGGSRIAIAPDGSAWGDIYQGGAPTGTYVLSSFSATGTQGSTTPLTAIDTVMYSGMIRFDARGGVWRCANSKCVRFDASNLASSRTVAGGDDIAFDAAGNAYTLNNYPTPQILKYSSTGTALDTIAIPTGDYALRIYVNPAGELVVFRQDHASVQYNNHFRVERFKGDGTLLGSYILKNDLHANDDGRFFNFSDMDAQGNLWVLCPSQNRMYKLGPDLAVIAQAMTYPEAAALDVDPAGKVWVYSQPTVDGVAKPLMTRYTADGTIEATAQLPASTLAHDRNFLIAADGHGNVWVPSHTKIEKYTF